jgi:hypothetical protein
MDALVRAHGNALAVRGKRQGLLAIPHLSTAGPGAGGERGDAAAGGEDAVVRRMEPDRPHWQAELRVAAAQLVAVELLVGHPQRLIGADDAGHCLGVGGADVEPAGHQQ